MWNGTLPETGTVRYGTCMVIDELQSRSFDESSLCWEFSSDPFLEYQSKTTGEASIGLPEDRRRPELRRVVAARLVTRQRPAPGDCGPATPAGECGAAERRPFVCCCTPRGAASPMFQKQNLWLWSDPGAALEMSLGHVESLIDWFSKRKETINRLRGMYNIITRGSLIEFLGGLSIKKIKRRALYEKSVSSRLSAYIVS